MTDPATGDRPGFIRNHSEAERQRIVAQIVELLERVEEWHGSAVVPVKAQPGSLLAAADELSIPFPVSLTVNQLLMNAVDHLHALRELFVTAHAQHIFAPYTLIRSALESGMTVLFMLRARTAESAAVEALRYEWGNIAAYHKAALAIGVPEADANASRKAKADLLNEALVRCGGSMDQLKGLPTVTDIMKQSTEAYGLRRLPYAMWQMCSAATHGKQWATPMLGMLDAVDDSESATITGQLMSDEASIRDALFTACYVLEKAFEVRETHSRP